MKICVVSGSRADYGMLEWPVKLMRADPFFEVTTINIWGQSFSEAFESISSWEMIADVMLMLGDRFEILAAATAAHLARVPIAHIGGGDVTEGSYDDAMRDAISRMATVHFVTSTSAMARLTHMGYRNVHLVGNPGADYIIHADWKKEAPYPQPYVVVALYPETLKQDGAIAQNVKAVEDVIAGRRAYWVSSNPDRLSDKIPGRTYTHDEFLNLIAHSDELIGNSSAILYEAPLLNIKTRMIGARQRGRTIPMNDGNASERIANILRRIAI